MQKLRLVTKKLGSKSLKSLAQNLSEQQGYKVWRAKFPKINRINLKYGDLKNKLDQYKFFKQQGLPALDFTTDYEEAKTWVAEGKCVVVRRLLSSSEGKGIEIVEGDASLPKAPVYTLYRKKKREFRVHVYKEKVVCVLEKRKKAGMGNVDFKVRNTINGYVFCRNNVSEPNGIRELAIQASKVNNSDFKGVDIGYNELKNELFVIEVNSAPGMQGTTVTDYAKAILS